MEEKNKGKNIELEITAIAYGGKGLAKLEIENKIVPVFVKNAVPGDEILAKITRKHKKYLEAEIIKIIKPSANRINVICEHFNECGCCDFLNLEYSEQLKCKTQMLKAVLERNNENLNISSIIPPKKSLNYRIRSKYKVKTSEKGTLWGFHKPETHILTEIKKCFLLEPLINEISFELKKKLDEIKTDNDLEIEIIKNATKEEAFIRVKTAKLKEKTIKETIKNFCETKSNIVGYNIDGEIKKAVFEIDGLKYDPECFTQVNPCQNKNVVEMVVKEAEGKVLDLYCGIGNYTLPLSEKCQNVIGVEGSRKSYEYALINSKGKKNITIINSSVEEFLDQDNETYDAIILNPSRRSKPIDFGRFRAKKIIYVSCNPEQLSRDLKALRNLGWKIKKIQPIDMFPQTYHLETIAVLEINTAAGI